MTYGHGICSIIMCGLSIDLLWTEIGETEMAVRSNSKDYQKGLMLAESARYEEAFDYFRRHIESCPRDGQAWNDAGTVLYCLGQIDEAIKYFDKARGLCTDTELAEVYWNLCEAYLDGGYPELAAGLFDELERFEILNVDCFNRTAKVFLDQGAYGKAIEMLIDSLSVSENQEILYPMIEVIRSKRVRVAFFSGERSESIERLFDFFKRRFVAELHIGRKAEELRRVMEWCDIAWYDGCDEVVEEVCRYKNRSKVVVRVSNDDVSEGRVTKIDWGNVDAVVLGSNPSVKKAFLASVGDITGRSRLVTGDFGVDVGGVQFRHRERGKSIACVCDLSMRSNPLFMLHCMQKLYYLDSDYRLYVAGRFADSGTKQYVSHIVESLGLSEVVKFESGVEDLSEWFSDKHYIVWTGMGEEGLGGVLKGMACGLKPLVHNFPGSSELLDSRFLFNLSEDFCRLVMSESYEPQQYRDFVAGRYGKDTGRSIINEVLIELEKEVMAEGPLVPEEAVERDDRGICEVPVIHDAASKEVVPVRPAAVQTVGTGAENQGKRKIIPIKPLGGEHVKATPVRPYEGDCRSKESRAMEVQESIPVEGFKSSVSRAKGINDVAAEALEASRSLSEMIERYESEKPSDFAEVSNVEFSNGGGALTSPEIAAAEERLGRMVSEFCEDN